jgi:hypothetical protein
MLVDIGTKFCTYEFSSLPIRSCFCRIGTVTDDSSYVLLSGAGILFRGQDTSTSPVRPGFGRTFCRKDKRVPFGLVATQL